MFEGPDFSRPLDEDTFNRWMEDGKRSKLGYRYMLIIWDQYDAVYQPVYVEHRDEIDSYKKATFGRERLVSVYDLYSESKVF